MKLKQLEIKLQKYVAPFESPKVELEQYHTPASIAATVVHCMFSAGDVEGRRVCDLGCGTGMLTVGCALMGCARVLAVDVDEDALRVMRANLERLREEDGAELPEIEMVCEDVARLVVEEEERKCDVVVTNPPFGTRTKGADMVFSDDSCDIGQCGVFDAQEQHAQTCGQGGHGVRAGGQTDCAAAIQFGQDARLSQEEKGRHRSGFVAFRKEAAEMKKRIFECLLFYFFH